MKAICSACNRECHPESRTCGQCPDCWDSLTPIQQREKLDELARLLAADDEPEVKTPKQPAIPAPRKPAKSRPAAAAEAKAKPKPEPKPEAFSLAATRFDLISQGLDYELADMSRDDRADFLDLLQGEIEIRIDELEAASQ